MRDLTRPSKGARILVRSRLRRGLVDIGAGGADDGPGLVELGHAQDEGRRFLIVADVLPVEFRLLGAGLFLGEQRVGAGEA